MSVIQMYVVQMSVVQMSVVPMSAVQRYVDEVSVSQMYDMCSNVFDQKSLAKCPLANIQVSVVKLPVSMNVCLVDKCL